MDVVRVPRTDPSYNAHGYLTKVPEGAIRPFIERYTRPGETVLDPFAGSGMTGVAARILGRNAELSDISVLGKHVGENLVNFVSSSTLQSAADDVISEALKRVWRFYTTRCCDCGEPTPFGKLTWSFVYACQECGEHLVYYELLKANGWRVPSTCPACSAPFQRRRARRVDETPVLLAVTCSACRSKEERPPSSSDLDAIAAANRSRVRVPELEIPEDREMYRRSALGRNGMTTTASFFSRRNAVALTALHKAISALKNPAARAKLLFAFTAILPRASKRYQWHHKRPLNAQNQTYYVAPVFYEWNVFDLFARKVRAAIRSDEYIQKLAGDNTIFETCPKITYSTSSADSLRHLADESVDYVFTDPPFGSNLFYSDMSLFQEAWLGKTTDPSHEAVIHTDKARRESSALAYEDILTGALVECWRVLKPGRFVSIVFSNSRGEVWGMLQRAVASNGFEIEPDSIVILDKGQRSVKGLSSGSEGVVTIDLVLTLRKVDRNAQPRRWDGNPTQEYIARLLNEAPPSAFLTPSHAYLHIIRSAVRENLSLEPLHFSEVLVALRSIGYSIDKRSGRLCMQSSSAM